MKVYLLLSPFTTPNTPTADHCNRQPHLGGAEHAPGRDHVGGRVSGAGRAEVDDHAEAAAVHQQVGPEQVGTDLGRRAVPGGRGQRAPRSCRDR